MAVLKMKCCFYSAKTLQKNVWYNLSRCQEWFYGGNSLLAMKRITGKFMPQDIFYRFPKKLTVKIMCIYRSAPNQPKFDFQSYYSDDYHYGTFLAAIVS